MNQQPPLFQPFTEDATVITVGNLAFENRSDRVTIAGDVDITCDTKGYRLALELKARIDHICASLQSRPLPPEVTIEPARVVPNPLNPRSK